MSRYSDDGESWERGSRAFVYLSEYRARYPSLVQTRDGQQIALFTSQSKEQEQAGIGELMMVRRTGSAEVRWWKRPRVVYAGTEGEPRAPGTLTSLSNGHIIAPFVLLRQEELSSQMHMLHSVDDAASWQVGPAIETPPLMWAAPNGRIIEVSGELIMPLFGAVSADSLRSGRFICGILRSQNQGKTWSDWSPVAEESSGQYSYEYPAMLLLADGTLVAVLTRRSLSPTIDAPQVLIRCHSSDGGRTWTPPEQLAVGSWPSLVRADEQTTLCVYSVWSGWGEMRLLASRDGLRSFTQDLIVLEHGWMSFPEGAPRTPLYADRKLEGERPFLAYHPLPLPPVVPSLKGDWSPGHFGFPAGLALSSDQVVILFGNRQRGTAYTDPPEECEIPIEKERIEAITFTRFAVGNVDGSQTRVGKEPPNHRWELAESWTPRQWRERNPKAPRGGAVAPCTLELASGRRLRLVTSATDYQPGSNRIVGRERGYWVSAGQDNLHYRTHFEFAFSDDEGRTWHASEVTDPVPLASAAHLGGTVFQQPDGTVVAPMYGYLNDHDMSESLYVSAIVRSRDGGETWGDWSIVAYDANRRFAAYSEASLVPAKHGPWIAFIRTEVRTNVPYLGAMTSRATSNDGGRTWSEPCACMPMSQPAVTELPDGGIAVAVKSHGRQAPGVFITYDLGQSWSYSLAGPYEVQNAGVLDADRFWVDAGNEVVIYRRMPRGGRDTS